MNSLVNVLFIRGLTRESRHWRGLDLSLQKLCPNIIVHSIDLPGVGKNNKITSPTNLDDYVYFLRKELGEMKHVEKHLEKHLELVCIGISLGGMIALRWAQLFPKEIKKVFVINCSARNLSGPRERFNLSFIDMKRLTGMLLTDDFYLKEERILTLTTASVSITPELINEFVDIQKSNPVSLRSTLNQLWAASTFSLEGALDTISVVVISGLKDRLVSPNCSKKLAEHIGVKLHAHPDAGHDLALDDPLWLLSIFRSELRL